jgi:outer membrane receptor for ferrienterochelin and colicins
MKKISTLIILIILGMTSYAQKTDANIFGDVQSEGKHMPYVTILLKGTTIGTATDATGHFMMTNLPEGTYTLRAQYVGYIPQEIEVTITKNTSQEVNFELKEDLIDMEGVVISATRGEVNRKESSVIVNVLDSRVFEATQAVSLAEGLNFQPGLRVENNCQNCGFSQLRLNGLEGPYTQILINSRPIFSALNGVYGLEQIPPNLIERVEVVRGGGSALYGANAIGGTVNIITKDPISNTFLVGSHLSMINMEVPDQVYNFNTSIVSDDGKNGIFLFGMHRNRQPWDANGDDISEITKLRNNSFGFRGYHRTGKRGKLIVEMNSISEFRRGGNDFDKLPHFSEITEQVQSNVIGGGVTFEAFSKYLKHKWSIYSSGQGVESERYYGAEQDPDAYGFSKDLSLVNGVQLNSDFDKALFAPSKMTIGFEHQYSQLEDERLGDPNILLTDQEVSIFGLFAQNEWALGDIKFLIGARADKHNMLDKAIISPRGNILYNISDKVQLRASYARGFRAPQVYDEDLHVNVAGATAIRTVLSNDLKEEHSNSYTLSVDYTSVFDKLQAYLLVEGFYTTLKDQFISVNRFDNLGMPYYEKINGSGAMVFGSNLEMKVAFSSKFDIQGGLTIQRSQYEEEEEIYIPEDGDESLALYTKDFVRTPNVYGYFNVNYEFTDHFKTSLTGTYTGSMIVPHVINADGHTIIENSPAFVDAGAKISYLIDLTEEVHMELSGGIQNMLNSMQNDYDTGIERDSGYIYGPSKPRTIFVSVKIGNSL